eukprot:s428_g3.t1
MSSEPVEETLADGVAEADESMSWPNRHLLASVWEESSDVRQSLRQNGKLLIWPKAHLTGVGTVENLRANRVAVHDALKVWAEHTSNSSVPKSPPVDWLREEACPLQGFLIIGSWHQSPAEDPNLRPLMDVMAAHWQPADPVPPQLADPENVGEPEGKSTVEHPTTESLDDSEGGPMGEQVGQSPKHEANAPEEPAFEPVYDVEELRLQREAVVQLDFSSHLIL